MAGIQLNKYVVNSKLVILVKPNKKETKIINYYVNRQALVVNVAKPAQDNKANHELVKFFTKKLGCKVKIISGLKNKLKTLRLI